MYLSVTNSLYQFSQQLPIAGGFNFLHTLCLGISFGGIHFCTNGTRTDGKRKLPIKGCLDFLKPKFSHNFLSILVLTNYKLQMLEM